MFVTAVYSPLCVHSYSHSLHNKLLKLIHFSIQNFMSACAKIVGGRGSAPDPAGEAYRPPSQILDFLPIRSTLSRLKFTPGYAPGLMTIGLGLAVRMS